jgi:hypothetical protein
LGQPDDHSGIAVFLCSRASDFVTGTAIPLADGYSIQPNRHAGGLTTEPSGSTASHS